MKNHRGETVDQWLLRTVRTSPIVHAAVKLQEREGLTLEETLFVIASYTEDAQSEWLKAETARVMRTPPVFHTVISAGTPVKPSASLPLCVGEWRCRCPSDPAYDTSVNPPYVSACTRCGERRP